jgi:hypothetical protein
MAARYLMAMLSDGRPENLPQSEVLVGDSGWWTLRRIHAYIDPRRSGHVLVDGALRDCARVLSSKRP